MFKDKNVLVTGGAGFIGSHVVDELLSQGAFVTVVDNMSTGQPQIVQLHSKNKNYNFLEIDLLNRKQLIESTKGVDFVFHLAANADIRGGVKNSSIDLEQNVIATHNVLEAMRINEVKGLAFSSSAAVYGTQNTFPTLEDAPKIQTSLYGASKLSCEAFIEAYSLYYGITSSIYRFVSVVGERYPHGVVIDFYRKLKKNPHELEILGDGKQKKSFMYVKDCVAGIMAGIKGTNSGSDVFNLGQNYTITVNEVADIITKEMKLENVKYCYTGGNVGWLGDQPVVLLSTNKIVSKSWKPIISIEDGLKKTINYLLHSNIS
ncbi:MAG: NAD-dependent epimerase/dehydratase family protein [Candidatus Micrarchaeota archaeon]